MKKAITLILAVLLLVGCSVGGTLAWLSATTDEVVNTFTYGDIKIDLKEHELKADGTLDMDKEVTANNGYKVIPGVNLKKDPFVRVEKGSEKCYIFIEVLKDEISNPGKITWEIAPDWKPVVNTSNSTVYYQIVDYNATDDQTFDVIKDNQIIVNGETLTKADIDALPATAQLSFVAYAVQFEGMTNESDAWNKVATLRP